MDKTFKDLLMAYGNACVKYVTEPGVSNQERLNAYDAVVQKYLQAHPGNLTMKSYMMELADKKEYIAKLEEREWLLEQRAEKAEAASPQVEVWQTRAKISEAALDVTRREVASYKSTLETTQWTNHLLAERMMELERKCAQFQEANIRFEARAREAEDQLTINPAYRRIARGYAED